MPEVTHMYNKRTDIHGIIVALSASISIRMKAVW